MSKALDYWKPEKNQLNELKKYSQNDPELKQIFIEQERLLQDVMSIIEKFPDSELKRILIQACPQLSFICTSEQAKTYLLYKTSDERDQAITIAKQNKKDLEFWKEKALELANKHNDVNIMDEMNKKISEYKITDIISKQPLSDWRKKKLTDFIDNNEEKIKELKDISDSSNYLNLSKDDLKQIKGKGNKGPSLKDVSGVTRENKQIVADKNENKIINSVKK